jgi:hypothetical protein
MAASLLPSSYVGLSIVFTASESVFIEADVGRQIIFESSRAIIVAFGANTSDTVSPNPRVRADIIDPWPGLDSMPPGTWFLRLSPQCDLDPDKKGPPGTQVTLVASKPAFRAGDTGKYIKIYGGVVRINTVLTVLSVVGEILAKMEVTEDDPPPCPAGAWTLETSSWSDKTGYPRTGEFYQGRLTQASTRVQPTTWWMSATDDFDNYATGTLADSAIEYTIASRRVNRIEWVADIGPMLMGTSGAEFRIQGQNQGDPLGGDMVPDVKRFTSEGSAGFQPVVVGTKLLFFDRSQKKIFLVAFSLEDDSHISEEITALAEHIAGDGGIRLRGVAFAQRPDPRIYMVRRDGQMAVLTYFAQEKVVGFTRFKTDGLYESVAVVPRGPGLPDRVWVTVSRFINNRTVRFVEYFDDDRILPDRDWTGIHTDCSTVFTGTELMKITAVSLPHLIGKTVNIVADGSFRGTRVVPPDGYVPLEDPALIVECGLDYHSRFVSMRPSIQGSVIEGMPRAWNTLWLRMIDTVGGVLNTQEIRYPAGPPGRPNLWTGDREVNVPGDWDTLGRITIEQLQPYPMTVLALFGELSVGDHD